MDTSQRKFGLITQCPYKDCGFQCCDIDPIGAIVLYPGELDEAHEQGLSVEHLEIIGKDVYGGAQALCHAEEKSKCDGGYKPLDCASYPVWPLVEEADGKEIVHAFKGDDCPLENHMVENHARRILTFWSVLGLEDPRIAAWLVHYTNDWTNPEGFSVLM